MTLALLTTDTRVRECFRALRTVRARDTDPDLNDPGELSMGMSGDYEIAIEESADCIRVGHAVFGARTTANDLYWPTRK